MDVSASYACFLFGGFNNVVFTDKFVVTASGGGSLNFFGGVHAGEAETNADAITELPYSITVNNGVFARFGGGNLRYGIENFVGSIAAPITITINGGTFGEVGDYPIDSNNKNYNTFSSSGMSILADDATLTINGGTFNSPIYAQGRMGTVMAEASQKSTTTASDKKYYAIDGDIEINITGGTFNGGSLGAYYTQAAYTQVMRGNFDVTVTGGTFADGTIFDATQVKAYEGGDEKATLTYSNVTVTPVRFDVVNGETQKYDEPLRVVFIGDSITEGYADSRAGVSRITDAYPARFLYYAEEAGIEATENKEVIVGNYGVSASAVRPKATRDYFKMLAWPMVSEESDADYVFIAIGTNDASAAGGTKGSLDIVEKNYTYLIETMGNLPETDKVFITNTIYRGKTNSDDGTADGYTQSCLRASAVIHPVQERVANAFIAKDADKYVFVDFYGLTLDAAADDSLFKATNGTVYERLHPTTNGLDLMGNVLYKAAFEGVTAPADYKMTEIYISDEGTPFGAGTKDAPISYLTVAFDKIALDSEVTIYVDGTYTCDVNMFVPLGAKKVTFVGVDDNATLVIGGNTLKLGTDTKFDNLTLSNAVSGGVHIVGCFNNVEITDTVKTEGTWSFYAGYNVFGAVDPSTTDSWDTSVGVSSDEDCTITINGGAYSNFMLGSRRFAGGSPFGTYSGDMTVTVGENVTIGDSSSTYVGIVGHNYLTGTINITLDAWGEDLAIKEYAAHGTVGTSTSSYTEDITYKPTANRGKVTVTLADGMENDVVVACDFTGDGKITVADVLQAIKYCLGGFDSEKADNYYGEKLSTLTEVLVVFKKASA